MTHIVRAFAESILHGDKQHEQWLLEAAEEFIAGLAIGPLWIEIEKQLPSEHEPVLGFHPDWIDEDFNPKGVRECFRTGDGTEWICSMWFDHQDCYETLEEAPLKWTAIPDPTANAVI